ncbi:MAG: hypothetical protein QOH16_2972 [Gaiellaceae bacterium]|jgi:CelD/BcsL family acetyltransferase involved in cellulose biosynthesis|nr:hypothetical protein [Gaiellaceae bacterium]
MDDLDWPALDALPDRLVFQSREWLEFLARTQHARPVVARVVDGDTSLGWFTGAVVRRARIPILGSPFPGWTTAFMGFNLDEGVSRADAARALPSLAWRLRCVHVELKDRWTSSEDLERAGFEHGPTTTWELALDGDDEELFSRMTSSCRRAVRKSEKESVTVEVADDLAIVDEYYAQLGEVFARQGLRPTYSLDRVRALVECLRPAGRVLCLRARRADGLPIASAIFPFDRQAAYFWGGASAQEHQIHRPNEAIMWHAMRAFRDRGLARIDLAGGGDYKQKYGAVELRYPFGRRALVPGLLRARDLAARVVSRRLYGSTATVPAGLREG